MCWRLRTQGNLKPNRASNFVTIYNFNQETRTEPVHEAVAVLHSCSWWSRAYGVDTSGIGLPGEKQSLESDLAAAFKFDVDVDALPPRLLRGVSGCMSATSQSTHVGGNIRCCRCKR